MATRPIPDADTAAGPPVACSLTRAGLAEQAGRWERLAARALVEHTQTATGLRMCFRPEPGAEGELRALAAVETGCCPWATWTVRAGATALVLDVRSTGEGIAVLHGMFTGLRQAPARADEPGASAPGAQL